MMGEGFKFNFTTENYNVVSVFPPAFRAIQEIYILRECVAIKTHDESLEWNSSTNYMTSHKT